MRIKHFQGYGFVNAKKERSYTRTNEYYEKEKVLVIHVWGNHEWGIERNDTYDIFNWLVTRFDKSVESYMDITDMTTNDYYEKNAEGLDEEHCVYTLTIKKK